MNIVVIGGGSVGKFGNDFVKRAQLEGHTVRVLSHRSSKDTSATLNFLDIDNAVNKFNEVTSDLETIDLFLYNTTYKGYPDTDLAFTSKSVVKEKLYVHGFYVQVIIPHCLCIEALKKMNAASKIVFMTTDVIYDRERTENLEHLGYYGGKAYQHQLMLALAECNDKGTTVSSVSPFFEYNNKLEYNKSFVKVYEHILGKTDNGKVFDCWE